MGCACILLTHLSRANLDAAGGEDRNATPLVERHNLFFFHHPPLDGPSGEIIQKLENFDNTCCRFQLLDFLFKMRELNFKRCPINRIPIP